MRKRKWDIEEARRLLKSGLSDNQVAIRVNATQYAIRIFRLREKFSQTHVHRRYILSNDTTDEGIPKQRHDYRKELEDFITRKAAEAGITYDQYKKWLFHTKEGIEYCCWMNRQLTKDHGTSNSSADDYSLITKFIPKKGLILE